MSMLEVKNIRKIYDSRFGGNKVQALTNICFNVEKGEFVAIMGESGSGKTTLLNILATLDKPSSGEVLLDGQNICAIKDKALSAFRRDNLGFVFQDFNLLDTFSIQDNIFLPLVIAGKKYNEMSRALAPLADKLGIKAILSKYPYEVSGGQKQRAAVARALITDPHILLANEPTGALDSKTILMVTHSVKAACHAGRVLFIKDGQVFHQLYRGDMSEEEMYGKISDTLTVLQKGGRNE